MLAQFRCKTRRVDNSSKSSNIKAAVRKEKHMEFTPNIRDCVPDNYGNPLLLVHQQHEQPGMFEVPAFHQIYEYDSIDYQHIDSASLFAARFHLENFPDHANVVPRFNIHFPTLQHDYSSSHHSLEPRLVNNMDYPSNPNYEMDNNYASSQFHPVINESNFLSSQLSVQTIPQPNHIEYAEAGLCPSGKKRRTNYRKPEHAAKLHAAVNALIMQKQGHGDIRAISKLFNIPYNTLRDHYLRYEPSFK